MRYLLLSILLALPGSLPAQGGEEGLSLAVPEQDELAMEEQTETVVEETEHEVVPANTLWDLSDHYYKDPWLWPRIWFARASTLVYSFPPWQLGH